MTPSIDGLAATVSRSLSFSTSPSSNFPVQSQPSTKQLKPFATEDVKVLLLENVNETGRKILKEQGYQVEFHKSSLPEDELIEKIRYDPITARRTPDTTVLTATEMYM